MTVAVALDDPAYANAGTNGQLFQWTGEYLAYVLPLPPEAILGPAWRGGNGVSAESRREWRLVDLAQRLAWLYGADEALRRLNRA